MPHQPGQLKLAPATKERRDIAHEGMQKAYKHAVQHNITITKRGITRANFDHPAIKDILDTVRVDKPYPVVGWRRWPPAQWSACPHLRLQWWVLQLVCGLGLVITACVLNAQS
jgi:hypothetical protein